MVNYSCGAKIFFPVSIETAPIDVVVVRPRQLSPTHFVRVHRETKYPHLIERKLKVLGECKVARVHEPRRSFQPTPTERRRRPINENAAVPVDPYALRLRIIT